MPNWKIHIEVAKRINEKLNLSDSNYEEFLLGNILPDINNDYLIKSKKFIEKNKTHFISPHTYEPILFYEKYKNQMDNYLVLGYYVHLLTDHFWNKFFYHTIELNMEHTLIQKIKHREFLLYANKFIDNKITFENIEKLTLASRVIKEILITEEDVKKAIDYINNEKQLDGNYEIFNEELYDELMMSTICQIEDIISDKYCLQNRKYNK